MPTNEKSILDLIRDDNRLAAVIDRFGIGFQYYRLPLEEACKSSHVDSRFVITIYKAFECDNYFPTKELQGFPLRTIIEYLIKTHLYYLNNKLPKLEKLIDVLVANYGNSELMLFKLKDFFTDYKRGLVQHIQTEEFYLFPYILKLIKAAEESQTPIALYSILEKYSLKKFVDDHDHVDDALEEVSRRIRIYTHSSGHTAQVNLILDELKQFEHDLTLHGRLEDEVLLPLAQELEEGIKSKLLSVCVNN